MNTIFTSRNCYCICALLLLALFTSRTASAQEDARYLAGAVPVEEGRVTFSREIKVPALTQERIFELADEWAKTRFVKTEETKGRILYTNPEKGEIACFGDEFLTFKKAALVLDRSQITYQMILICEPGVCKARINGIRYAYQISSHNVPERYVAEELITDEHALNKRKDKLLNTIGKFRIHTVDLADKLFEGLENVLSIENRIKSAVDAASSPGQTSVSPESARVSSAPATSLAGYKKISPENIPGNIIKMVSQDWMLISAGKGDQSNMMTAGWGGLGQLYGKPVAFCFIHPSRYTYELMEKNETYTLCFFTETHREALKFCGTNSGRDTDKVKATGLTPINTPLENRAFGEAWMIIECQKTVCQQFTPESIQDPAIRKEREGQPLHKMYIGEILNVWVK